MAIEKLFSSASAVAAEEFIVPRSVLNSIGETIYDWDLSSDRIAWGPNAIEILPVAEPATLLTGREFASLLSWDSQMTRFEAVTSAAKTDNGGGARYHAEYGILLDPASRNSAKIWVEDSGRCFASAEGRAVRAHGAIRIMASSDQSGRMAGSAARLDRLTGTLNRGELTECINRLFRDAKPGQGSFAMLLIAIDGMAAINHNYGYDTGDTIIAAAARRLQERMRGSDIIARYAGNRFAMLLQNCDTTNIQHAAQRFAGALNSEPLKTPRGAHKITARTAGVCAPRDARNPQQLYQHTEEALDNARNQPSRIVIYTPSLAVDHERLRTQAMAEQILDALNQRRVGIALQPIVSARTGKPVFYEALLRMTDDEGRRVSPSAIIPVAEKTGLIALLDQRVTELAIEQVAANPALTVSFNISGITAHDPDWLAFTRARLDASPGTASRLIAEITETIAIADVAAMRDMIGTIRATGMRVAMDDFGAGYSSFKNLRELGIDLLKIDGAFVQNLARSADDRFFVRTLADLASHLQIPVVAEWVENQETATLLAEWGVDYCQGSWFGMGEDVQPQSPSRIAAA